jgi:hypothetical protein
VVIETGATATAMGAKLQTPSRESPYWGSMRNTLLWLAAQEPSDKDWIRSAGGTPKEFTTFYERVTGVTLRRG